ncbi:hypothetical protein PVAP13_2NG547003 [Panicum virgatum]|uniref:Uncharacterized protein n=1 Tax=Panicum virgatum TaxID=38727 RepID=A0A8T0VRH0_PANVG|nr:hypothetical protein PVAP13_2NG547003 [Panicum virgatum]
MSDQIPEHRTKQKKEIESPNTERNKKKKSKPDEAAEEAGGRAMSPVLGGAPALELHERRRWRPGGRTVCTPISGATTAMVSEKTATARSVTAETTPIATPARRWICYRCGLRAAGCLNFSAWRRRMGSRGGQRDES